jgi:exodeoxyribonuclease VII large subunit
MDRPLFDPAKMAAKAAKADAGPGGGPARGDAPLTVTELAGKVDDALRLGVPQRVRVVGEVSGFRERTHWYFDLKDTGAVVNCVMFAQAVKRAGWMAGGGGTGSDEHWRASRQWHGNLMENGRQVVATGRVGFYAKGGKLTLTVEALEMAGAGALEQAFRALCEELRRLGWFGPERKRALPTFPGRVAVVTSRTGAALQDVLDTMRRRCPAVDVAIVDALMQGDKAAADIAAKIAWIGREHARLGVDVLILTRGGGSMEDLWAFNERVVAEAVLNCPIPVVAAIGHETDTTIAELVADERAATPTQAAMRVTPDARALLEQVSGLEGRLRAAALRMVRYERERVRSASRHPVLADPAALVRAAAERVENAARHLRSAGRERIRGGRQRLERAGAMLEAIRPAKVLVERRAMLGQVEARLRQAGQRAAMERRARLEALARELDAVGPAGVLARGYSVTVLEDGRIVRSAMEVAPGDRITTRVADGQFGSVVGMSGPALPIAAPAPLKRPFARRRKEDPNQPGLFGEPGSTESR